MTDPQVLDSELRKSQHYVQQSLSAENEKIKNSAMEQLMEIFDLNKPEDNSEDE
jgi:hypothetical protein